jgi:hypothetical protein
VLTLSFVVFAGWFVDTAVPLAQYPALAAAGIASTFGSINVAVPFLLDLMQLPTQARRHKEHEAEAVSECEAPRPKGGEPDRGHREDQRPADQASRSLEGAR